jgi:hypothetical protein
MPYLIRIVGTRNKDTGNRKQETGNRKQDSSDVNLFFKVLCTEYLFG